MLERALVGGGMQHNLRDTIRQISVSSSQLASASEELSCVTEDATRGLHQQSLEIEQAATAVNVKHIVYIAAFALDRRS